MKYNIMKYNKITNGFVVQKYITLGSNHICIGQEFVAGDEVDREDENGSSIDHKIDTTKENYQSFDMVSPNNTSADNSLIFTCPECGKHRLECCEDGSYNSEITDIDEEGDFEYGPIDASGDVDRFQCLDCGYILPNCTDNEDVVDWIKENCKQADGYIDPRYTQELYLIRNRTNKLYWSNIDGWVDVHSAQTYTKDESSWVQLPIDGTWTLQSLALKADELEKRHNPGD